MASTDTDDVGTLSHQSLLILIWVCFGAAFLLVAVRTGIRLRSPAGRRAPPLDDCFIFFALAAFLALCILETIQLPSVYYVTGILTGAVPLTNAETIIAETENYLRFQFPITILFWTVLWSVKAAFLALYWRLFRDLPWYRRAWYVLAVFTFLVYGGCVVTLALSCGPDIRNFFRFAQCAGPEHVWTSNFSVYYSTASDVFTDLCSKPLTTTH
jgi:glucan phosphoethanolaminetransferase (alkaline phosphatase superfamily)